ncbi:restriction endonuclease subunit S [Campylobacter jejuni]|uniref:Restriction endonuclease subunit S n=1 Tax=Campylobacter jejuni TaxID=197 RepID=A0A5T0Q033_CAMJU|nr:restriction endonuclease subunit S [Campylobacter jejuni]EAJ0232571.1 restriction endonuclease subunit S [Campylobacter jejuni]EAK1948517.1 restriction endonuclease subunit S [Campylobacter jejuni]EAL4057928.1 restriction endonuclease subunit S [Campylobacter jejuni]EAL7068313.1 restriction endonuclease subunit S [Campylobacter jejuni]
MKNFKDSGIEWLGEIPEHWEVVKINKIVTFVNGYAFENFDFNPIFEIPVIRIGDMQKEKILYDNCLKTKEKEKLKQFLISNNDILIALSGATTGKIAFCDTDNKAYINQRVAIVRSKLKLVKYYFLTRGFSLLIELACNGSAQPNISTKEIGEFKIPLPPLKEQEQIAKFLDEKCEQIKNFIEKKEKLITLLKEQKQAFINKATTKGLDKNVNFKDSGIEWLGEIPEHWKLIKCKNFFVLKSIPIGDLWNKTKLLSLTLNGVIERDINNPEGKFPSDFSTYQIVKEGDLIFCLFDVAETPRTIGLSKLNGMITSAYTIFEIKNQEKRFLEYFFIDLDNRKNLKFLYRGLRNTISKEDLLNLKIPLPPLKEQEQIANFLDEKCKKIDLLIEKTEKQIKLIKEYKTTLTNQAVCGRINL